MIFDPSTGSARDRNTIRKHSIISLQRKLANLEKSWWVSKKKEEFMDFPIRMDPWRIIEKKFFECEQFETFFSTVVGSCLAAK